MSNKESPEFKRGYSTGMKDAFRIGYCAGVISTGYILTREGLPLVITGFLAGGCAAIELGWYLLDRKEKSNSNISKSV